MDPKVVVMSAGKKSPLWHELKRRAHLVTYLEMQLSSGRYAGDMQKAKDFIESEKTSLVDLESKLKLEALIAKIATGE